MFVGRTGSACGRSPQTSHTARSSSHLEVHMLCIVCVVQDYNIHSLNPPVMNLPIVKFCTAFLPFPPANFTRMHAHIHPSTPSHSHPSVHGTFYQAAVPQSAESRHLLTTLPHKTFSAEVWFLIEVFPRPERISALQESQVLRYVHYTPHRW